MKGKKKKEPNQTVSLRRLRLGDLRPNNNLMAEMGQEGESSHTQDEKAASDQRPRAWR